MSVPACRVRDLSLRYGPLQPLRLRQLTLTLMPGERLALVGESGAGKSSFMSCLSGFLAPTLGGLEVGGVNPYQSSAACRQVQRQLGQIRQQPRASLDPSQTALDAVAEVAQHLAGVGRGAAREMAVDLLNACGLTPLLHARRPHALSGGECQRVAAARALVHRPKLLLADEPTASLDPIVAGELLGTLLDRASDTGCSLIYVTHDLFEPERMGGQLGVLLDGLMVEWRQDFAHWHTMRHPYSRYLAQSRHQPVPARVRPEGGCPFSGNCPLADEQCFIMVPPQDEVAPGHTVRCWHQYELG
jgi:ABC-type glutathione transport system ATPase component